MPPRGEHSRDELRALVLAASREIAEAKGLKGLTARAIAGRIGYSPGTLYNLFEDLDDVVIHLNAETLDDLFGAMRAVPRDADPETALLDLARAYIGFARSRPRLWSLVFDHALPEGRELPPWYQERIPRLLDIVSAALAPLFPPGEERRRDHSARVLWSATQGIGALASAGKLVQAESVDGLLGALITYHVRGIRASDHHPDFEGA